MKDLSSRYHLLTPFERSHLYLAAIDRHDTVEQQRLVRSAGSCARTVPDHAPYVSALCDLAEGFFMELLEMAACFNDALTSRRDTMDDLILLLTGFVLRHKAAGWACSASGWAFRRMRCGGTFPATSGCCVP